MTKITLAVFGSLGDLHPMISVGLALKAQGAQVTIASQIDYGEKVLNSGLDFHPMGMTFESYFESTGITPEAFVKHMATSNGFIFKTVIGPHLAKAVEDIRPLISRSDAVVATSLAYHAEIAAKLERKHFMVAHLSPGVMFSAYDPLKSPEAPLASGRGPWGRSFNRLILALGGLKMRGALAGIRQTYQAFGVKLDLRFVVLNSDLLTLGLYSPLLGGKEPDHPTTLSITGYPFYDSADGRPSQLEPELQSFLDAGPAPLVFSLGSAAVFGGEAYYRTAIKVALGLKQRAVILAGHASPLLGEDFGPNIWVSDYAQHSLLFPHAAAIVHHGGIGSAGQALLSGRPQLVTPVFSDQFDNADRICRLGVGAALPFRAWKVGPAKSRIKALLDNGKMIDKARTVSDAVARETGAVTAANLIISALSRV